MQDARPSRNVVSTRLLNNIINYTDPSGHTPVKNSDGRSYSNGEPTFSDSTSRSYYDGLNSELWSSFQSDLDDLEDKYTNELGEFDQDGYDTAYTSKWNSMHSAANKNRSKMGWSGSLDITKSYSSFISSSVVSEDQSSITHTFKEYTDARMLFKSGWVGSHKTAYDDSKNFKLNLIKKNGKMHLIMKHGQKMNQQQM